MTPLQQLKFNIQENKFPHFEDEELEYMLEQNNGDIDKTSYDCLIMKSESSGITVSGLTTKDNSSYFKMLAQKYQKNNSGILQ